MLACKFHQPGQSDAYYPMTRAELCMGMPTRCSDQTRCTDSLLGPPGLGWDSEWDGNPGQGVIAHGGGICDEVCDLIE